MTPPFLTLAFCREYGRGDIAVAEVLFHEITDRRFARKSLAFIICIFSSTPSHSDHRDANGNPEYGPGEAVSLDPAKEIAKQYAEKYLRGFTVERVLPFTGVRQTMYNVEWKGPKGEVRFRHINPRGGGGAIFQRPLCGPIFTYASMRCRRHRLFSLSIQELGDRGAETSLGTGNWRRRSAAPNKTFPSPLPWARQVYLANGAMCHGVQGDGDKLLVSRACVRWGNSTDGRSEFRQPNVL